MTTKPNLYKIVALIQIKEQALDRALAQTFHKPLIISTSFRHQAEQDGKKRQEGFEVSAVLFAPQELVSVKLTKYAFQSPECQHKSCRVLARRIPLSDWSPVRIQAGTASFVEFAEEPDSESLEILLSRLPQQAIPTVYINGQALPRFLE